MTAGWSVESAHLLDEPLCNRQPKPRRIPAPCLVCFVKESEDLLQATTERTLQETRAWMSSTLTMLEVQRDTVQYEDMDIPAMMDYIKHTVVPIALLNPQAKKIQ